MYLSLTHTIATWQVAWLQEDLATPRHAAFIITTGHRPLYCTDGNRNDTDCVKNSAHLRSQAEDLLLVHKVDLVLQAHKHGYERTYPVNHGQPTSKTYVNPGAPTYIVNGAAGNREVDDNAHANQPYSVPNAHTALHGYSRIVIAGSTLQYTFVLSSNRTVFDTFTITKTAEEETLPTFA